MSKSITPFEKYGRPSPITDARLKVHTFRASDTLSGLAERYLGNWLNWRQIADRNGITDVRRIAPGTKLIIPAQELETGRFEST